MPTARQHFEQFPEPYRSQAIENTPKYALEEEYETARVALGLSFIWYNSPQGHEYWFNFLDTLC